ncbi:hypothetical protein [Psychroserpens mesophilus]|uniref:hypothetical protein n=1 Tax=Psychroserpens mesophilus TaxID=325473 RepID=UPI003F493666
MNLEFRTYTKNDQQSLIDIFETNCPKYFDVKEKNEFIYYLDHYTDDNYLVAIADNQIIGCGGLYTSDIEHRVAWVMFKNNSLGVRHLITVADKFYFEIEKRIIAKNKTFNIGITTTQLMASLFSKYGFETYDIIPDGIGKGLDAYYMKKTASSKS